MFKWINRSLKLIVLVEIFMTCASHGTENLEDIQNARRQYFEKSLDQIKREVYDTRLPFLQETYNSHKPNIFISYAWENDVKPWVDQILSRDLNRIGFEVLYDQERIMAGNKISAFEKKVSYATYVVVLCTPQYLKRYNDHDPTEPSKSTGVGREMKKIMQRLKTDDLKGTVLPIYRKGDFLASVPSKIRNIAAFDVQDEDNYYSNFFILCQNLFLYGNNNAEPIRGIKEGFLKLIDEDKIVREMQSIALAVEDKEAIFLLAKEYEKKGDTLKAFDKYYMLATHHHVSAQEKMREIYSTKKEIFEDPFKMFLDYSQRSDKGEMIARIILGWMYSDGFGVPQDYAEAIEWFEKAADQGHVAAQYALGELYRNREDYAEAIEWFEKAADQGHVAAQYALGKFYRDDQGGRKDDSKARELFEKAADQGHVAAQYALGEFYRDGQGGRKDDSKARELFKKAADQEHVAAQYALGVLYRDGQGGRKDDSKAMEWFKKAADQEHVAAQYALGVLYRDKERDYDEAKKWFGKAADLYGEKFSDDGQDQGHADAQYALGVLYKDHPGVYEDSEYYTYTVSREWFERASNQGHADAQYTLGVLYRDKEEDTNAAIEWLEKAANQRHVAAQYALGVLYRDEKRDYDEAKKWFKEASYFDNAAAQYALGVLYRDEKDLFRAECRFEDAANQGHADAQYALGVLYRDEKRDDSKAMEWFKKAADQDNASAQYALGQFYEDGYGGKAGKAKAIELFEKAAKKWLEDDAAQDDNKIQYALGVLYRDGLGVPQDYVKARKWFKEASYNADAQYQLGVLYRDGLGVWQNYVKAKKWFEKAADQEHAAAQYALDKL